LAAQTTLMYQPTALGTIGGDSSEAYAINDFGQIVGRAQDSNDESHIFHWQNGQMHALLYENLWGRRTLPTALYSVGYGISNTDHIVGTFLEPYEPDPQITVQRGVIFSPGTSSDDTTPYPGELIVEFETLGAATGISPNGRYVVGWMNVEDSQIRGIVLEARDGTWSDPRNLSALDAPVQSSSATAVNDSGQVVGWTYSATHGYAAFLITPLESDDDEHRWHEDADGDGANDLMISLGTLGGTNSWARAINSRGWIVGEADTADWYTQAFIWVDGQMTDLGTLGGSNSSASGINDQGVVVGWALDSAGRRRAFVVHPDDTDGDGLADQWFLDEDGDGRNDLMSDLNNLLPSGFSMRLTDARDVNESGQIVGWGETGSGNSVLHLAFLLEPVAAVAGATGAAGVRADATLEPIIGTPNNIPPDASDPNADTTVDDDTSQTGGATRLGLFHFLCGMGIIVAWPAALAGLCGLKLGLRHYYRRAR